MGKVIWSVGLAYVVLGFFNHLPAQTAEQNRAAEIANQRRATDQQNSNWKWSTTMGTVGQVANTAGSVYVQSQQTKVWSKEADQRHAEEMARIDNDRRRQEADHEDRAADRANSDRADQRRTQVEMAQTATNSGRDIQTNVTTYGNSDVGLSASSTPAISVASSTMSFRPRR